MEETGVLEKVNLSGFCYLALNQVQFLEFHDADLHDFRDSPATREVYVHDSVRLGIRRNRARVLIRRAEIVAITRFDDIATF